MPAHPPAQTLRRHRSLPVPLPPPPPAGRRAGGGLSSDAVVPTAGLLAAAADTTVLPPVPRQQLPPPRVPRPLRADSLHKLLGAGCIDALSAVAWDIDQTLIRLAGPSGGGRRPSRSARALSVEPHTAAVVRRLQDVGLPIFGLTSRSPTLGRLDVPRLTRQQLHQADIDLGRLSPLPRRARLASRVPATCQDGIVYCGNNSKAHALALLSQHLPLTRLVVVDDNIGHFPPMARWAAETGRALTLVYYTAGLPPQQARQQRWPWWRLQALGWRWAG